MCNGIAVLVYEKDGELKGLCAGISSHDILCREDEDLRYGKIEPWRFELLYPCNLVYDRGHNKPTESGLFKEQPQQCIWDVAIGISNIFRMKHTKHQLQSAYLREADLEGADLRGADLRGANLRGANLRGADLREADLEGADLRGADLRGAKLRGANLRGADLREADLEGANLRGADYNNFTVLPTTTDKSKMIQI